jgi:hypothetical protein
MVQNNTIVDPRLRTAQQRIDIRRQQLFETQQIKVEAQRLDSEFRKNLVGDIKELEKQYQNIPENIRNQMDFSIAELKKVQENRIEEIKIKIEDNNRRINNSIERQRRLEGESADRERAREIGLIEENKAYLEGITRISQGTLIPVQDIVNYARDMGYGLEQKAIQQYSQKRAQTQITTQLKEGYGKITEINYETGRVVVDGQTIQLTPTQARQLELTSVTQAKTQKQADNIINKIEAGQKLTSTDYSQLEKLGYNIQEVRLYEQEYQKFLTLSKLQPKDNKYYDSITRYISQQKKFLLNVVQTEIKKPEKEKIMGLISEGKIFKDYRLSDKFLALKKQAERGDKTQQAILLGIAATGTILAEGTFDFVSRVATGLINTIKNPKEKIQGAINFFSQLDEKKIREMKNTIDQSATEFGRGLQRGDPEAVAVLLGFAISTVPFKIPINIPKRFEIPKTKTQKVDTRIEELKKTGVNIRDRNSPQAQELRYLESLKSLETDIKKLDTKIKENKKLIRPKVLTEKTSVNRNKLKTQSNEINKEIKQIDKKIELAIRTANKITKGDIKKAEGLAKLFEIQKIKITSRKLIMDTENLDKMLIAARAQSGQEFAKLKKRIKKELNKNVVERKVNGRIEYKILDPKEQRKKDKPTGKKAKTKEIRLEEKPKVIDITPELKKLEKNITIPQLDKIEKQLAKEIGKGRKDMFNKKAQASISISFQKISRNVQKGAKIIKNSVQKYKNNYQKILAQNKRKKEINTQRKGETFTPKQKNKLSTQQTNLVSKIKVQLRVQTLFLAILSKYETLAVQGLKQIKAQAQGQVQEMREILDNIQKFKFPTKPIKPIKKPTEKTITPVRSPVRTITPTRPIIPKRIITPKKTVVPKRIIRAIKKPIRVPTPIRKKGDRVEQNMKLGEISYIITNPKTQKRDVIKIKTDLPYTEAKALAKQVTDNTLLASFSIREYGERKKRLALKNVDLQKFTRRKGKDPKVRKFVEKSKFRLDKKTEKKEISQARLRQITKDKIKEIKKQIQKK